MLRLAKDATIRMRRSMKQSTVAHRKRSIGERRFKRDIKLETKIWDGV